MGNPPPPIPTSAPLQDEVSRVTNIIMAQIGETDIESALTVVCNLAGQLVASVADGRPSAIREHTEGLLENIQRAAITKILYDDAKARKYDTCH